MLHGDRTRFAIEWEVDDDPAGPFLLGRVCYWIGGKMVGVYNETLALVDMLGGLTYAVGDCGQRHSNRFCGLSPEQAFYMLQRGLLDCDPELRSIIEEESWDHFNLSTYVSAFDGWRLYLIDCAGYSRLLIGRLEKEAGLHRFLYEQRLEVGEFDRIIKEFAQELEATWERHR